MEDLKKTLTARLEETIRLDVISGALPPGQKLRLAELADRYGVSITPLREALQRLAQNGLVVLDAQVGARVSAVSLHDAEDIYDIRLLLEPEAVSRSVGHADDTWLKELSAAMDELRAASVALDAEASSDGELARARWAAWGTAHNAFHAVLVDRCGSQWLRHFIEILHQHSERYRNLARGGGDVMRAVLDEHEHLFGVATSGDADAAAAATQSHLRLSMEILAKIVDL